MAASIFLQAWLRGTYLLITFIYSSSKSIGLNFFVKESNDRLSRTIDQLSYRTHHLEGQVAQSSLPTSILGEPHLHGSHRVASKRTIHADPGTSLSSIFAKTYSTSPLLMQTSTSSIIRHVIQVWSRLAVLSGQFTY